MHTDYASTYNYTNMQGFGDLRRLAREDSPEAAEAVARQFEAVFIQMMLKSMRAAAPVDTGLDGEQARFFRDMFDQQIALEIAQGEGIGLRQSLLRELAPTAETSNRGQSGLPEAHGLPAPGVDLRGFNLPGVELAGVPVPERRRLTSAPRHPSPRFDVAAAHGGGGPGGTGVDDRRGSRASGPRTVPEVASTSRGSKGRNNVNWPPATPEDFLRELWPHAEAAGRRLGVAPEVLLAQSALETGWGRHVIPTPDGGSSYNLFGIKADARWRGPRASVQTLEFVNGVPERQRAAFRAYANPGESFSDYVDFLNSNPRYRDALARAPDAEGYLRGLQSAGYATDPNYADKILSILQRGVLRDWVGFKLESNRPLT